MLASSKVGGSAGGAPGPADDRVAVPLGEVLPEGPVPVVGEAASLEEVQRGVGLGDLPEGEWRQLKPDEIAALAP